MVPPLPHPPAPASAVGRDAVGFVVRSAEPGDLAPVRALLAAAGLPVADVEARFGPGYAVALDAAGAIVGAEGIEVHGRHGLLRSAVVAPAWRGRGVGAALTRDRLAWARAAGLEAVYLLTTTAAAYFPRHGFERVERATVPAALQAASEFASVCPASAIVMRLPLAPELPRRQGRGGDGSTE